VTIKTIDAHAEGGPLRLIVDGFPSLPGRSMAEKQAWAEAHADTARRALVLEPRGHADMCAAVLTEPVSPGAHAGIVFMDAGGYPPMSGHGIIAAATIALEHGLIVASGTEPLAFDTVAGTVRAFAHAGPGPGRPRVRTVTFESVPAFVLHGGVALTVGGRSVRADVAFGGAFYALVDSEAAGLGVDPRRAPELRRAGLAVAKAVEAAVRVRHPEEDRLQGLFGTIFTGPPAAHGADLRNVTVCGSGRIERSAGGTGTAATVAVLAAMGLCGEGDRFVSEGPAGTVLRAEIARRARVAEHEAVICRITGSAWITGEHTWLIDPEDPLAAGVAL
jgi:proline racemase